MILLNNSHIHTHTHTQSRISSWYPIAIVPGLCSDGLGHHHRHDWPSCVLMWCGIS